MFDLLAFGEKKGKTNHLICSSSIDANTRESRNQSGIGLASIFLRSARTPCFPTLDSGFVLSCGLALGASVFPCAWRRAACFPSLSSSCCRLFGAGFMRIFPRLAPDAFLRVHPPHVLNKGTKPSPRQYFPQGNMNMV